MDDDSEAANELETARAVDTIEPSATACVGRIIVAHAFGAVPKKFWYPALAKHFRSDALAVHVPALPGGSRPSVEAWMGVLRMAIATTQHEGGLILVGHSLGCNAILRILADQEAADLLRPLRGVLAVAGWMRIDEPWPEMLPWLAQPPCLQAARGALSRLSCPLTLLVSDNDRFTRDWELTIREWREGLGASTTLVPGAGHFGGRRQPAVLAALESLVRGPGAAAPCEQGPAVAGLLSCADACVLVLEEVPACAHLPRLPRLPRLL